MQFDATIAVFARALANPGQPAPSQTRGRNACPDARRFAIYRNNVAVGLITSLEARYPITRRLVGDEFFRGMAHAFATTNKPASPVLLAYGAGFSAFVESFPPAQAIPYLGEVARLENAYVESYHSSEAAPMPLADLAGIEAERLGELVFHFHPAVRLLSLTHPAASIWAAHQLSSDLASPIGWRREDVIVTRPHADVSIRILPPGGWSFVSALIEGASLAQAAAVSALEGADPGPHLVGLFEVGALTGFK